MIFFFHKKFRVILFYFIFLVGLFCPALLLARSTPNVPIDSPIYQQIDKLIAFQLVDDTIYAQRPWSRHEVTRIVGVSLNNYSMQCRNREKEESEIKTCGFIGEILDSLKKEFQEELVSLGFISGKEKKVVLNLIDNTSANFDFLESPYRTVLAQNGVGVIDAKVNSFTAYQQGRHYVDGWNWAVQTVHWGEISKFTSFYFNPQLELMVAHDGSVEANPVINKLYTKFNFGNFELEVGRDSVIWGHSAEGGVFASSNSRAYDMIKISNDTPFRLPWLFKYLGYQKYTTFLAHLGPESIYKNSLVYGFAASLKPFSFLEVGFERQFTFDGDGASDYDLLDLIYEFFFNRRSGALAGGANIGDHRIGGNLRIQIPPLHNLVLYAEGIVEDKRLRVFWSQFTQQMAFQGGIYFPLLTLDGKNSLRIQYEHIPAAYGRQGEWQSGLTLNDLSRGAHFASQSQSVLAEWEHFFTPQRYFKLKAFYANNGNDFFTSLSLPGGGTGEVVKTVNNPDEYRFLVSGSYRFPLKNYFLIEPQLGYEFVSNFNFQTDNDRHNFHVGVGLTYEFNR